MEVVQKDDYVTSVLDTKTHTHTMRATDDTFLLHMLISSLYSDPLMALVRETITNGWDAHKDAGITDTPLQINVSIENGLVIQDFGKGIPKDQFFNIYGIFGESTKRQDINATGGFGLGCKSPLAYTNGFTVVSACNGTKTTYAINLESDGLKSAPAITEIISVPTEETGLTVRIPIIQEEDVVLFTRYVRAVLFRGGIKGILNGTEIPVLDLSNAESCYAIIRDDDNVGMWHKRANILYGNVIYPFPEVNKDDPVLGELYKRFLGSLSSALSNQDRFVFIAEPNSISLVPSREAVSMSETTINTIHKFLNTFFSEISKSLISEEAQRIITKCKDRIKNQYTKEDLSLHSVINRIEVATIRKLGNLEINEPLVRTKQVVHLFGSKKAYNLLWGNKDRLTKQILPQKLVTLKNISKKTINDLKRELIEKPLYKALYKINPDAINKTKVEITTHIISDMGFVGAKPWREGYVATLILGPVFVRKVIILSHTVNLTRDLSGVIWNEYVRVFPHHEGIIHEDTQFPLVRVPRNRAIVGEVKGILEKIGYRVIDLTETQKAIPTPTTTKKSGKKEADTLHGGFTKRLLNRPADFNYVKDDLNRLYDPKHKSSVEEPVWYLLVPTTFCARDESLSFESAFEGVTEEAVKWADKKWPNKGIAYIGHNNRKFEGTNVLELYQEYLSDLFLNSEHAVEYIASHHRRRLAISGNFPVMTNSTVFINQISKYLGVPLKCRKINKKLKDLIDSTFSHSPDIFTILDYKTKNHFSLQVKVNELELEDFLEDSSLSEPIRRFFSNYLPDFQPNTQRLLSLPGAEKHIKALFNIFLKENRNG